MLAWLGCLEIRIGRRLTGALSTTLTIRGKRPACGQGSSHRGGGPAPGECNQTNAAVMKLYHFTTADKVLPIKERGLLPSLEPQMSPDHAVVCLTSQQDVSLTERDAKAMALWLQAYEAPLDELKR